MNGSATLPDTDLVSQRAPITPENGFTRKNAFLIRSTVWFAGIAATVAIAFLVGQNHSLRTSIRSVQSVPAGATFPLADATSAVSSEKFSMATGTISDDADGLFLLDHNSGLLQCQVIYPRSAQIMARFSVNVAEALGTGGKGGSYLMLTGRVNFPRASNNPAAQTVVYVMDSATGNFACFGIPFNTSFVNANRPQNGALVPVASGSANPLIDRDLLR